MAKLLQKLTEMSCGFANQFIQDSNEFLTALKNDNHVKTGQFESKVNAEFAFDYIDSFVFGQADMINFESNTQLLTDETIDISGLVQQLQQIAKKHNQSLMMMAEQSKLAVKLRVRATQIEKESVVIIKHLRKSLRENAELLLNEIMKLHRSPAEMPRYMQNLLPKIYELDNECRNRIYQRTLDACKHEYQLAEVIDQPMLANFPQ